MIQMGTILQVADNTGAKKIACIRMLGGSTAGQYAGLGDVITASVKEASPDGPLLHGAVRRRFLHRRGDDVAQPGVLAGRRAAQHPNAGDLLRAGVVGNLKNRSHLNHDSPLNSGFRGREVTRLRGAAPRPTSKPRNLVTS